MFDWPWKSPSRAAPTTRRNVSGHVLDRTLHGLVFQPSLAVVSASNARPQLSFSDTLLDRQPFWSAPLSNQASIHRFQPFFLAITRIRLLTLLSFLVDCPIRLAYFSIMFYRRPSSMLPLNSLVRLSFTRETASSYHHPHPPPSALNSAHQICLHIHRHTSSAPRIFDLVPRRLSLRHLSPPSVLVFPSRLSPSSPGSSVIIISPR